ncbi:MAG: hypothetical protein ACJATA_001342 [Sphingobacteriales bacterium]|jgi:hypothetical protein
MKSLPEMGGFFGLLLLMKKLKITLVKNRII